MKKIRKYFKGVAEETHRVRWPSAKELWPAVGIVIGVTVICAIVLAISDYLALEILRAFQRVNPNTSSTSGSGTEAAANAILSVVKYIGGKF
jgi:preprotein translocase SecE subunit